MRYLCLSKTQLLHTHITQIVMIIQTDLWFTNHGISKAKHTYITKFDKIFMGTCNVNCRLDVGNVLFILSSKVEDLYCTKQAYYLDLNIVQWVNNELMKLTFFSKTFVRYG